MDFEKPPLPDRLVLEYARPMPTRWPKLQALLQDIRDAGPWFAKPSILTIVLFFACCATTFWLSRQPPAWRLARTANFAPLSQPQSRACPVSKMDAIVVANAGGRLNLWRPWTGQTLWITAESIGAVRWINLSADQSQLMVQAQSGTFLFDARTGKQLARLAWGKNSFLSGAVLQSGFDAGALSADATRMAMLDNKGALYLWDMTGSSGKLLASHPDLDDQHRLGSRLTMSDDGRHLLIAADSHMWLVDVRTLDVKQEFNADVFHKNDASFASGGKQLAVIKRQSGSSHEIHLYDCETGKLERSWKIDLNAERLKLSPDGGEIFVPGYPRSVCIDIATNSVQYLATEFMGTSDSVEFFPDGKRLVGAGSHGGMAIVDLPTGRQLAEVDLRNPPGPQPNSFYPTQQLIVSAESNHIAAVCSNGAICVFDKAGDESAYGVVSSGRFWLMCGAIAFFVVSFCRDAIRTRKESSAMKVSWAMSVITIYMITFGALALVFPFTWAALGQWDSGTWWYNEGWIVWAAVGHLVAGIGLLMRGRGWGMTSWLIVFVGVLGAMAVGGQSMVTNTPQRIFDRLWIVPALAPAIVGSVWMMMSVVTLIVLGWFNCLAPWKRPTTQSAAQG